MAYKVELSARFNEDVRSAIEYIGSNLDSPQAAARLMDKVDSAVELLSGIPSIDALSRHANLAAKGARVHFVLNYAIAYVIKEDTVMFVRFFHQSQLYESDERWPDSV